MIDRADVPAIKDALAELDERDRRAAEELAQWRARAEAREAAAAAEQERRNSVVDRNAQAQGVLAQARQEREGKELELAESHKSKWDDWYRGEPDGNWIQSKWDDSYRAYMDWAQEVKATRRRLNDEIDVLDDRVAELEHYIANGGEIPEGLN